MTTSASGCMLQIWLSMPARLRVRAAAVMSLLGMCCLLLPLQGSAAGSLLTKVDRSVPDFSLMGLDEELWDGDRLQGKPWVINFWATWCPPCIEEIPSMNAAWTELEPAGVGMLAINVGEDAPAVMSFVEDIPIDFPVLLGNSNVMSDWSARALPTTVVLNAQGQVVFEAIGPRDWSDAAIISRVIELVKP